MHIIRRSTIVFGSLLAVILGGGFTLVGALAVDGGYWIGLLPLLGIGLALLRRPLRRWNILQSPPAAEHVAWLQERIPYYSRLDSASRDRFDRDLRIVMHEWSYEGINGAPSGEMERLAVASGAALMLNGRPDWELRPQSILFYSRTFDEDYYEDESAPFDGMAHRQGAIIFSVRAVRECWGRLNRPDNVVLHELAHLFDFENTYADGIPSLLDRASIPAWNTLIQREINRVKTGRSILRAYAALNEAELFAVSVETFYERPFLMKQKHPELYEALAAQFQFDPCRILYAHPSVIESPDVTTLPNIES